MRKIYTALKNNRSFYGLILVSLLISNRICGQIANLKLYPFCYESQPEVMSPAYINDTVETILIITKENKYGLAPVTVENGKPLLYSFKVGYFIGKDQQLYVDKGDFPYLAQTGLHSEDQLDNIKTITSIPVNVINCTGRPNAYSTAGFLANEEVWFL